MVPAKMGRKPKEESERVWEIPLCRWGQLCLACQGKDHIKKLAEKYADVLSATVHENRVDWFGEG